MMESQEEEQDRQAKNRYSLYLKPDSQYNAFEDEIKKCEEQIRNLKESQRIYGAKYATSQLDTIQAAIKEAGLEDQCDALGPTDAGCYNGPYIDMLTTEEAMEHLRARLHDLVISVHELPETDLC